VQITQEQADAMFSEYIEGKDLAGLPNRVNYPWVDVDGIYDIAHTFLDLPYNMREFIYKGKIRYLAMQAWVDDPVHVDILPELMRLPWGTYPSLPPKPAKN
jgi:hypothetical protein